MSIVRNPEEASATVSKTEVSTVPACKVWFPCDETGTITELTDAVSGSIATITSSTAASGGITIPNSISPFSGTLPTLSGDFALLVLSAIGTVVGSISFGGGVSERVAISSVGSAIVGASGTASLGNATNDGVVHKTLITSDVSGPSAYQYEAVVGASLVGGIGSESSTEHGVVTLGAEQIRFETLGGPTLLYGICLLDFSTNGLPADIVVWADWTMEQWAANNKVLPHRFTEL